MTLQLADRCRSIDLLVMDVDGVLTDGRIVYSDRGEEIKAFHVRDGSGIKLWLAEGKQAALLSGRKSEIVQRRAAELGIATVIQGADDKGRALRALLGELGRSASQTAYIGDDLPDVPALRQAGLALAVADACPETQAAAHYVTRLPGGHGAVREVIELLLRHQERWQKMVGTWA